MGRKSQRSKDAIFVPSRYTKKFNIMFELQNNATNGWMLFHKSFPIIKEIIVERSVFGVI
jgi:hypothetical protein